MLKTNLQHKGVDDLFGKEDELSVCLSLQHFGSKQIWYSMTMKH